MNISNLTLKRCRQGWMFFKNSGWIGPCLDMFGEYGEQEVMIMDYFLRPGDTAIDVGANIGVFSIPMAKMVGAQGRVISVESHADVFNILNANAEVNQLGNIFPVNAFISNDPGTSMTGSYAFVSDRWTPQVIQLDDLALDNCRFIKIDVDGREINVLRSAETLITNTRPILYFENEKKSLSTELLSYVRSLGYDMWWHYAPIFKKDNFYAKLKTFREVHNPGVFSPMTLAVPMELQADLPFLPWKISDRLEWIGDFLTGEQHA